MPLPNKFFFRIILAAFLLISCNVWAATENYKIDNSHSFVLFHISHFGFSNQTGKWFASGTINLDEQQPQNTKVDITIPMGEMVTGIPDLDKHLRDKMFFDVDKYKTATFVSDKVTLTGKKSAKVQGTLTLHGVSKPVVLDVTLNQLGNNPMTEKKTVGFTATTKIKRSDFGISAFLPGLGDEVKLDIQVEANLVS